MKNKQGISVYEYHKISVLKEKQDQHKPLACFMTRREERRRIDTVEVGSGCKSKVKYMQRAGETSEKGRILSVEQS